MNRAPVTEVEPGPAAARVPVGHEVGDRVTLRIGTQTLAFRTIDRRLRFFLHHDHDAFRVDDGATADCELIWSIGPIVPSTGPLIHAHEQRWQIRRLAGGGEEIIFSKVSPDDPVWRPTMQMVSDAEFRRVHVRQAPRSPTEFLAYVSEYPWAEYVMQRRLGLHGAGAILHASMAVIDGQAHLFTGHSGAGKSTIAELAERLGAEVPTDDRSILTVADGRAFAWGTPWHGSFRRTSPAGAPIASISLLVQDRETRIERMSVARAVQEMFVRTVQARVTPRETQNTLATLEQIASATSCFELRFQPTVDAVRLVVEATRCAEGSTQRGEGSTHDAGGSTHGAEGLPRGSRAAD